MRSKSKREQLLQELDSLALISSEADNTTEWNSAIASLRSNMENTQLSNLDAARQVFRLFSGGMCSFNDLVLYRDGKPHISLNEQFSNAKQCLLHAAEACLDAD